MSHLQSRPLRWFGSGIGATTVAPLIPGLWPPGGHRAVEPLRPSWYDAAMVAMAVVALVPTVDQHVVWSWPVGPALLLSFAVYAAARLSSRATAVVVAIVAVLLLVMRSGRRLDAGGSMEPTVLEVQQFVIITAVTSMGLSTLLTRLRAHAHQLEQRVDERTAQLVVANQRLQELVMTDPLTGVANRRALFAALAREMDSHRRHRRDLAVIMFDIDRFKDVNDHHGHAVGDRVLQHAAHAAAVIVRGTDTLARYGGEEFAVIAPEIRRELARQMAERIRVAIAQAGVPTVGGPISVTASFGVAMLRADDIGPESILDRADAALYEAKHAGRDRVVCERGSTRHGEAQDVAG